MPGIPLAASREDGWLGKYSLPKCAHRNARGELKRRRLAWRRLVCHSEAATSPDPPLARHWQGCHLLKSMRQYCRPPTSHRGRSPVSRVDSTCVPADSRASAVSSSSRCRCRFRAIAHFPGLVTAFVALSLSTGCPTLQSIFDDGMSNNNSRMDANQNDNSPPPAGNDDGGNENENTGNVNTNDNGDGPGPSTGQGCLVDSDCDDADPCTRDRCNEDLRCRNESLCTADQECRDGVCFDLE